MILSISSRNTMPFCINILHRLKLQFFIVNEFGRFFFGDKLHRLANPELPCSLPLSSQILEHALDLRGKFLHAGRRKNFHVRVGGGHLDFDFLIVQLPLA